MTRIDQIIEGLKILTHYDETGFSVCAEHDQIWAGDESSPVSTEHADILRIMNWDFDEDVKRWTFFV